MNEIRQFKVDHVVDILREEILSLVLKPGDTIFRPELRARFGLSSTPVRDALLRLERERMVQIFPQSRTIVTRIDPQEVWRAHLLRLSLDLEIARQAAAQGESLAAQLAPLLAAQEERLAAGDWHGFTALDTEFHLLQYRAIGAEALWHMIQSESAHMNRVRRLNLHRPGNGAQILADHRQILTALAARDAEAAALAVRQHLTRSSPTMPQLQMDRPELFV